MRVRGLVLVGVTACGPTEIVDLDGLPPVDDTESTDDDERPDDTGFPQDTAPPPEDTSTGRDTGLLLLDPVDYRYTIQLAIDPLGNVVPFVFGGRTYASGVWVSLSDGLGVECDLVYLINGGAPSADPTLAAFLDEGGYLTGLRLAPGTYVAYGPIDPNGNFCGIDPASPLAVDPHAAFLSDLGSPATPGEYLLGIPNTLTGDWGLVLPGITNLRPPATSWATAIARTAFDNPVGLGVAGPDLRRLEHGVYAGLVDATMTLQVDPISNAVLPVDPATWNVDGRAVSAVYLAQSFTMDLP